MKHKLSAIAAAYLLILLLLFLTAGSPAKSVFRLFFGPFLSGYAFANLLNTAGLLVLTASGIVLAFQSGEFNLGGEGQAYAGALTSALTALVLPSFLPGVSIPIYLIAGGLGGMILGLVSGLLKRYTGTSVLISSYLLSGGVIAIIHFLVAGSLREEASYLLSTTPLAPELRIPRLIPGTNSHLALLLVPLVPLGLWFFLTRTVQGYELRLKGLNRNFAAYGGISTGAYDLWPITASAFLHGFAGALVVGGNHFACLQGGTAGLGWNGIGVALIGGNHPLFVLPAALFIGMLLEGIESATLFSRIPMETGFLIQGLLFLLISGKARKHGGRVFRRSKK